MAWWVDAPGGSPGFKKQDAGQGPSHLFKFRYLDRRVEEGLDESRLEVVFRLKNGGPGTEGYYVPPDDNHGLEIFNGMQGSGHPYSMWLLPQVIKAGWKWIETKRVRG